MRKRVFVLNGGSEGRLWRRLKGTIFVGSGGRHLRSADRRRSHHRAFFMYSSDGIAAWGGTERVQHLSALFFLPCPLSAGGGGMRTGASRWTQWKARVEILRPEALQRAEEPEQVLDGGLAVGKTSRQAATVALSRAAAARRERALGTNKAPPMFG